METKRVIYYGINNTTEAYIGIKFATNNVGYYMLESIENNLSRVLALTKNDCDVVVLYANPSGEDVMMALNIVTILSRKGIKTVLIK